MKPLHCFLSIMSVLLLLHHCVSITLPHSLDREIVQEKFQPRRMLRAVGTSTVDMKSFHALADKKPQIEVNASLRKIPRSKSNPTQN